MSNEVQQTLIERVERLERANRRLKLTGGLALAVTAAAIGLGMSRAYDKPEVIEARSFRMYDENDNVRARLEMGRNGPRLALMDEKGKDRATMSVTPLAGPNLQLHDEGQETRVMVGLGRLGPIIQMWNQDGSPTWKAP